MAKRKQKDPIDALLEITCNYPHWSRKEILALHAMKHEVAAAAFRFYSVMPQAKGDNAVKDILLKWVNSIG